MKRSKFAGVLAAMLIFGNSTVYGATPSINLQNNADNTVTVKVQDIQKDIYGIQIELLMEKGTLNKDVVFQSKDENAYSFTVRKTDESSNRDTLTIYITSNKVLNVGSEAVLGNLLDVRNNQFLNSANYKVVDYFFSPTDTPNIGVDHSDESTDGNPVEPETPDEPSDSDNTGGSGSSGGSGNSNKPSEKPEPEQPVEPEKPVTPSVEFTDTTSHWASKEIGRMAGRGILKGYEDGTFGPGKQITRAEFAAVVARAFGFEEIVATLPFKDIQPGKWYTGPVVSLYEKGIIAGRPDGTFGVNDPITNQEMAVMISRSLEALAVELEAERSYVPFVDADTISSFAQDAVKELYEVGIISGMPDGTYRPKDSATRAQVAVIVDRILTMIEAKS